MNSQSPIYSLKFTITWIFVYGIIVFVLWQFIQIFLAIYVGLLNDAIFLNTGD